MEHNYSKKEIEKFKGICDLFKEFETCLGEFFYAEYLDGNEKKKVLGHLYSVERFRAISILDVETGQIIPILLKNIVLAGSMDYPIYYYNDLFADVLNGIEISGDRYDMDKLGDSPEMIKQCLERIEKDELGEIVWDSIHLPQLADTRELSRLGRIYYLDYFQEMFPFLEVIPRERVPFIPEEPGAYKLLSNKK